LSERAKLDLSYARPKRRFLADDLYLPSFSGNQLGNITVAIDCSGSITQSTLDLFSAELNAIIDDTAPSAIDLIYFDSEVSHAETIPAGEPVKLTAHGGGGTAFSPIFEHIALSSIAPKCCIVLTDLYSDDFGQAPDCPVLWASIGADQAPFGEIIQIKE
jgi:predicted metal-dependent peptidase